MLEQASPIQFQKFSDGMEELEAPWSKECMFSTRLSKSKEYGG